MIIASALSGVTDRLVDAGSRWNEETFQQELFMEWIHDRHKKHASAVLEAEAQSRFERVLNQYLTSIREVMTEMHPESTSSQKAAAKDALMAVGERLSVHLFALALPYAMPVDTATLMLTDASFGAASVVLDKTYARIKAWYNALSEEIVPVVTGFIGGTPDGRTSTLGRGGSDYSASILAAALNASKLERWTDVDGIYTNDPRLDPNARRLDYIEMEQALSWNKAGKMGLHRKTLDPLIEARVPLFVRSIDKPEDPGTEVHPRRYQQAVAC